MIIDVLITENGKKEVRAIHVDPRLRDKMQFIYDNCLQIVVETVDENKIVSISDPVDSQYGYDYASFVMNGIGLGKTVEKLVSEFDQSIIDEIRNEDL